MKTKATVGFLFTVLTFLLLLIPGREMSESVSEAVIFCGETVIPQLFLYLCLSSFVWEMGIIDSIISAFPAYGAEIAAFTIGILSGFPSGGVISGKLTQNGYITENRGEYLTTFSNNAGVSFVFGYIAALVGITGAVSIFICEILSSLLFALLWRVMLKDEDKRRIYIPLKKINYAAALVKGVKNAVGTMINICGFILFFSAFIGIMKRFPLGIKGLLEITTGLSLTKSLPFETRLVCCAMFTGFGGVCVHFQVADASGLKMGKFLLSKLASLVFFPFLVVPIHRLISGL